MDYRSRKHHINFEIFRRVETEDSAYVLGYLFADGWIRPPYSFGFSSSELEMVEVIQSSLRSSYPVYVHRKQLNGRVFVGYEVLVTAKETVGDLIRLGCVPRKSLKPMCIPKISDRFVSHFIRGYFDGDGGIRIDALGNLRFNLVGNRDFLLEIQDIFVVEAGVRRVKVRKHASIARFEYNGNHNACKLRTYLYKDASVFLPRKRDVFFSVDPKYRNRSRKEAI